MEQDEWESSDLCSACGARIEAGAEGSFGFGTENVLCPACAAARGGRYDAEGERWVVEPDLSGLGDEAYGAAPHEQRRRRD